MYELFILGELKDKPMHGYLLHSILSRVIGPLRQVSWGTLYPVLRRMEEEGYIQQTLKSQEATQGRSRKIYEITLAGERQFESLMRKPFEHTVETEDLFRVKLSKFMFIDKQLKLDILRQYKTFLDVFYEAVAEAGDGLKQNVGISEKERLHILTVLDYETAVVQAKLSWVEAYLARMEEENVSEG